MTTPAHPHPTQLSTDGSRRRKINKALRWTFGVLASLASIVAGLIGHYVTTMSPWFGLATGVLWLSALTPFLRSFEREILAIAGSPGRYERAFFLATWLTICIWGVGMFGGSAAEAMRKGNLWEFPWAKIIDAGILIGTFLGIATLWALLITLAVIRENVFPKAMSFKEALTKAGLFIDEYGKKHCHLKMCAYYPFIGAVNRDEFTTQYREFRHILENNQVECLCLQTENSAPSDAAAVHKIADDVKGRRPKNVHEAIGAFARMWFQDNDTNGTKAKEKFDSAVHSINTRLASWEGGAIHRVACVPDFHFILAVEADHAALSAFLMIPLRPAGMPAPLQAAGKKPPMVAMELHDQLIVSQLHDLYESLLPPTPSPVTSAPP
jgi:hypothetical protein